jgi:hypothetical protein
MTMTRPIYRAREFKIVATYTLSLAFDDATQQVIDFEPVLRGELYAPLRDPTLFNRVALDRDTHTLIWPNGADFDPATLHDWPHCGAAFAEMASHWEPARGVTRAATGRLDLDYLQRGQDI